MSGEIAAYGNAFKGILEQIVSFLCTKGQRLLERFFRVEVMHIIIVFQQRTCSRKLNLIRLFYLFFFICKMMHYRMFQSECLSNNYIAHIKKCIIEFTKLLIGFFEKNMNVTNRQIFFVKQVFLSKSVTKRLYN